MEGNNGQHYNDFMKITLKLKAGSENVVDVDLAGSK
jgi:hypothetical protein